MGTIWGLGCIVPCNREATSFYLVISLDVLLLSRGILVSIGLDLKVLFLGGSTGWEQYGVGLINSMLQAINRVLPCQTSRQIISINNSPGEFVIILQHFCRKREGRE